MSSAIPHLHGGRASYVTRLRRADYRKEELDATQVQLRETQAAVTTQQATQQSNNQLTAGTLYCCCSMIDQCGVGE